MAKKDLEFWGAFNKPPIKTGLNRPPCRDCKLDVKMVQAECSGKNGGICPGEFRWTNGSTQSWKAWPEVGVCCVCPGSFLEPGVCSHLGVFVGFFSWLFCSYFCPPVLKCGGLTKPCFDSGKFYIITYHHKTGPFLPFPNCTVTVQSLVQDSGYIIVKSSKLQIKQTLWWFDAYNFWWFMSGKSS